MDLLRKEFKLAVHPTVFIFMSLSMMLLIPNYIYYVVFFYTCLGIFFTCLSGRENKDILYMLMLPIRKSDIVKARFLFIIVIEVLQIVISIPFAIIRNTIIPGTNVAGMDANVAFYGLVFILFGLFNVSFLTNYYRDTNKVGRAFVLSSTVITIYICIVEATVHAIPFVKNKIDTVGMEFMSIKVAILFIGIVVYAILNIWAFRQSVKIFNKQDY